MSLVLLPSGSWADSGAAPVLVRLGDVTTTAVQHNPTVQEARLQWLVRQAQERAAWGDFEPAFVSSYADNSLHRQNTASEQVSQFGRTEYSEKKTQVDVGLEGRSLTGASYHLGYTLSQTASDFITGFEYQSTLGLNVEQPLLKGFSRQSTLAPLRLARLDVLIGFHTLRKQLVSVVSSVHSAYWDLVLAQERRCIAADSVTIAQNILTDAQARVQVGKMSELDLREAETQLALRVTEHEDRALDEQEADTRLRLLLADEGLSKVERVNGADALPLEGWDPGRFSAESETLAALAMKLQPDLAIKRAELEKELIRLDYSRDQALPELNAKASVGFMGLGDTPEGSLETLRGQEFPTWSVGIELRIPVLGDVKNRNAIEIARLNRELAVGQLQAAEKEIALSVDAFVRRVLVYGSQIETARQETAFRQQQLDVEMTRLDAGKSDIRSVYELEDGLSQARVRELESANRFRKALVDLAATSGTILKDQGLESVQDDTIRLAPTVLLGAAAGAGR